MSRAIREHLRDFLAIVGLVARRRWSRRDHHPQQPGDRAAVAGSRSWARTASSSRPSSPPPRPSRRVRASRWTSPGSRSATSPGSTLEDGHAVVTMEVENEVRAADQRRRLAAAAPEDRPQRHGDRGRSGRLGRERRGGLDAPARLDPAQRQPRRVPRRARRRHPGLPEAAAGRRRRGARSRAGPRPQALGGAAAARAVRPRHRQDQRRAGAAPREHQPRRSTTSACSATSWATTTQT